MGDNGTFGSLDDRRKNGEARWKGSILSEGDIGTLSPFLDGGVDGLLHIGAVEVDCCTWRDIIEGSWETENVPKVGAGGCNVVNVEAWVKLWCCLSYPAPKRAARCGLGWCR